MPSRQKGAYYELKAVEYLKLKGYSILETNFRVRSGEIDIIGQDKGCIALIEVKARKVGSLVSPLEAVDKYKQRRIEAAAKLYSKRNSNAAYRFDVVSIREGEDFRVYELIKGAFYVGEKR